MENKAFHKALSNLSFDFAARGAIRHLHDLGCTPQEIANKLSYPLPLSRIEEELAAYTAEGSDPPRDYEKITDAYGRTSFRRVPRKA